MAMEWSGSDRRKDHVPSVGRVVIVVRITVWDQVLVVVVIAVRITVISRIPSCCIFVMLYESRG